MSTPTNLSLAVGRPWYLAWWALLLWAAALGAVAWAAWVVVSWRSERSQQRLRALVDERTRELSEANRQLGERNVEMERFIYTVSHDLKSPLISISGFIGLLEPPEHHETAFELFRRLNAGIEGTGVGLSLVKRIVEVHDGRVWIESEGQPGHGTTVWLDLPAGQAE